MRPQTQSRRDWNPRHKQHGSGAFLQSTPLCRGVDHRYKPLHIVLKYMMKSIIDCEKTLRERKQRFKKRKNMYFRVTLMRRTKLFGDLPIITVTKSTT